MEVNFYVHHGFDMVHTTRTRYDGIRVVTRVYLRAGYMLMGYAVVRVGEIDYTFNMSDWNDDMLEAITAAEDFQDMIEVWGEREIHLTTLYQYRSTELVNVFRVEPRDV